MFELERRRNGYSISITCFALFQNKRYKVIQFLLCSFYCLEPFVVFRKSATGDELLHWWIFDGFCIYMIDKLQQHSLFSIIGFTSIEVILAIGELKWFFEASTRGINLILGFKTGVQQRKEGCDKTSRCFLMNDFSFSEVWYHNEN